MGAMLLCCPCKMTVAPAAALYSPRSRMRAQAHIAQVPRRHVRWRGAPYPPARWKPHTPRGRCNCGKCRLRSPRLSLGLGGPRGRAASACPWPGANRESARTGFGLCSARGAKLFVQAGSTSGGLHRVADAGSGGAIPCGPRRVQVPAHDALHADLAAAELVEPRTLGRPGSCYGAHPPAIATFSASDRSDRSTGSADPLSEMQGEAVLIAQQSRGSSTRDPRGATACGRCARSRRRGAARTYPAWLSDQAQMLRAPGVPWGTLGE
jgi:hypothetical protein